MHDLATLCKHSAASLLTHSVQRHRGDEAKILNPILSRSLWWAREATLPSLLTAFHADIAVSTPSVNAPNAAAPQPTMGRPLPMRMPERFNEAAATADRRMRYCQGTVEVVIQVAFVVVVPAC